LQQAVALFETLETRLAFPVMTAFFLPQQNDEARSVITYQSSPVNTIGMAEAASEASTLSASIGEPETSRTADPQVALISAKALQDWDQELGVDQAREGPVVLEEALLALDVLEEAVARQPSALEEAISLRPEYFFSKEPSAVALKVGIPQESTSGIEDSAHVHDSVQTSVPGQPAHPADTCSPGRRRTSEPMSGWRKHLVGCMCIPPACLRRPIKTSPCLLGKNVDQDEAHGDAMAPIEFSVTAQLEFTGSDNAVVLEVCCRGCCRLFRSLPWMLQAV
jgi:hypothetical protein